MDIITYPSQFESIVYHKVFVLVPTILYTWTANVDSDVIATFKFSSILCQLDVIEFYTAISTRI